MGGGLSGAKPRLEGVRLAGLPAPSDDLTWPERPRAAPCGTPSALDEKEAPLIPARDEEGQPCCDHERCRSGGNGEPVDGYFLPALIIDAY